jgi:RNA polymerase sigma-70 factor (ECF subfamily)
LSVCGFNHAIAEDAVHDAFWQIVKDWDKFLLLPCDKWRSRIAIIAKNKAIDILRKEKRYVALDDDIESGDVELGCLLEHKEDVQFLADCVAKLPDIYKIPLELRYYQELENPAIAAILGVTTHNVAVRISRAIVELRKIVVGGECNDQNR